MTQAYVSAYANVHRGIYDLANKATAALEQARTSVQKFLGSRYVEEVVFTRNATEAINLVAASYLAPTIKPDDEIIISMAEHHANVVPWHFLRERFGAKLVWIPVEDDGLIDPDEVVPLFTAKTRMLAITHMSNVLGTITPIRDIVRLSHDHGVPVLVDGAQAAAHLPVDVVDIDCDFYVFTGHKIYGPAGIGVLYGRRELLEGMPPYQGGGEMIATVTCDHIDYAGLPHKFEAGTPAIVDAVGLGEAIRFIHNLGWDFIQSHDHDLGARLVSKLGSIPDLRFLGNPSSKKAIFSFTIGDIHPHDLAMFLDQRNVAIRAGHHCAQPLVERFGVYAACRASVGLYNDARDVDRLAEALEEAVAFFKRGDIGSCDSARRA